jgi:SAM-dependent methyltransferase
MAEAPGIEVGPGNAAQLAAWDGTEGEFWASHADHFDHSVVEHTRRLFDAARIEASERVLDVGCGTGQTTREAARRAGSGAALGVDLSSQMLDVARTRAAAEGLDNARFEQGDAQVHRFEREWFDLAISRTGAMFFADPVAAFTNIAAALRCDARLVLVVWQALERNEWISEISTALSAGREPRTPPPNVPGPFGLADPAHTERVLRSAGFVDVGHEGFSAPMTFGKDVDDACAFVLGVAGWMLDGLDDDGRRGAIDALRESMARHHGAEGVVYDSASWLVTARRP